MTKHMLAAMMVILSVCMAASSAAAEPGGEPRWKAEDRALADRDREYRVVLHFAGCLAEAMANATAPTTPASAFFKSFLKNAGVQIQVGTVVADGGALDPASAAFQGFIIGL